MPFKIVIVGTSIARLGAAIALADKGHEVTLVEATTKLQPIGGSIVIQANGNRVLDGLGVYQSLLQICSTRPFTTAIRRYRDGEWLAYIPGTDHPEEFGYPYWSVYRADFQQVLYEAAMKRGLTLRLGCPVIAVDEENPVAVTKEGERIEGDLIVGADGIKSVVWNCISLDLEQSIRDSGLDVTRANILEVIMRADPNTSTYMDRMAIWFGPSTTIASVPVRRGDAWIDGIDFIHPRDDNSADGVSRPQNIEQIKGYFKDFVPEVQKILSYVTEAHVWGMVETMPASWVSKSGKVVLSGDAAHAVLLYAGQGGCIPLEDAVTLAECLDRAGTIDDILKVLRAY